MDDQPEDKEQNGVGNQDKPWLSRLAADIAASDAKHRQTWGDTDDLLLARYEDGLCTEEEKKRVEQAMRDFPAVREALEPWSEIEPEAAKAIAPATWRKRVIEKLHAELDHPDEEPKPSR